MLTVNSLAQPRNELGFFFAIFPLSPILLPLNMLRLLLALLDASLSILAGVSLSLFFLQRLALVLSGTNYAKCEALMFHFLSWLSPLPLQVVIRTSVIPLDALLLFALVMCTIHPLFCRLNPMLRLFFSLSMRWTALSITGLLHWLSSAALSQCSSTSAG